MGLFDLFISQENKLNEKDLIFLEEVRLAMIKYFGSSTAKLNLKDKKGEPTNFINAFPDIYSKCLDIKSPWDRRSLIFSKLDELFGNQIPPYVYAERLIEDRYPQKALEILNKIDIPSEDKNIYYTIFAKVLIIMGDYVQAIEKAKKALDDNPDYIKAKIVLADAYHLAGKTDEAHDIYDPILNKYLEKIVNKSSCNLNIIELFGAEAERMRSPILAIQFLKENSLSEEAWKWAENEFYYSPYFRCQHAYWMLEKKKEILPAFSKLLSLFKEMPWIKEAAINIIILIEKIDPKGDKGIAKEDITKIKSLINKNGWNSDKMNVLSINM